MSMSTVPKSTAGKLFIVSGLSGGREVFLGKAIDEPYEGHITLEGKVLSFASGFVIARPFLTTVNFFIDDPHKTVLHIAHPKAHEEAIQLLNLSVTHVNKSTFPLLYRWIESAAATATNGHAPFFPSQFYPFVAGQHFPQFIPQAPFASTQGFQNPFIGFYHGFLSTAEQFRRAIFHSRTATTTRELDKLAELEGNLAIEIGKLTNQIAIKFHQFASRDPELQNYLESFHGADLPIAGARFSMVGWLYLFDRISFAKTWARRAGKSTLVRELNVLVKEGIFGLSEVILDHCSSLDALITETFSQYGISYEIYGELSPFQHQGGPPQSAYERETIGVFAGSSV
jgi:hypothetical protein